MLASRRILSISKANNVLTARFLAVTPSQTYTERMNKTGRPVSPHVEIYKFPPTALSSIMHRVSGGVMAGGIVGLGFTSLFLNPAQIGDLLQTIGNHCLLGPVAKLAVTTPLVYHYLCGMRHVYWNFNPDVLTTDSVTRSSMMLFGTAGGISAIIAFAC